MTGSDDLGQPAELRPAQQVPAWPGQHEPGGRAAVVLIGEQDVEHPATVKDGYWASPDPDARGGDKITRGRLVVELDGQHAGLQPGLLRLIGVEQRIKAPLTASRQAADRLAWAGRGSGLVPVAGDPIHIGNGVGIVAATAGDGVHDSKYPRASTARARDALFWVVDVCESILFAEMAAVARETPEAARAPWLADIEHDLRVHAIVGAGFAIQLDQGCDGHEEQFLGLVAEAARRLARCGSITGQQAAEWIVLDGKPIIWRGEEAVDIGSIVAFADALAAIIRGTYPQAPPGHRWYFGVPGGVRTIQIPRPKPPRA